MKQVPYSGSKNFSRHSDLARGTCAPLTKRVHVCYKVHLEIGARGPHLATCETLITLVSCRRCQMHFELAFLNSFVRNYTEVRCLVIQGQLHPELY
jgi:hypothetical protein